MNTFFNSQELANTGNAYDKLIHTHPALFQAVAAVILPTINTFNVQELASTINAFANQQHLITIPFLIIIYRFSNPTHPTNLQLPTPTPNQTLASPCISNHPKHCHPPQTKHLYYTTKGKTLKAYVNMDHPPPSNLSQI